MNVAEAQARIKARIWQHIAQSEGEFKEIPQEQLSKLVDLTTNAALVEFDDELDEMLEKESVANVLDGTLDETILWQGRPFLSISTTYIITNERIRILRGLLGKDREDIELIRVQDMDQRQSLRERLMNVGDLHIRSHDPSHPVVLLNNVRDPQAVHEILRRAVLNARKAHNLHYREEM